jgi:hypothetical protein
MLMPEATVDKQHGPPFRKCHIRPAWQITSEQAKSKAESVSGTPYGKFWLGVLATHGPHIA